MAIALLCVRYRYDASRQKRFTTVELVVGESPWHPFTRKRPDGPAGDFAEQVAVRVGYREESLRRQVKSAGGRWNADRRLWHLPLGQVRAMGLVDRIVEG